MTTFAQAYKQELVLIQSNGGDKSALQFQFLQLKYARDDLVKYIERRSIEFAGREKALKEYVIKLRDAP